jgi:glucose uptake protein
MTFYFSILGATICYILGDFWAKIWTTKNSPAWLVGSLAIYFLGSLFFILMIKKSSLSLAAATAPLAIALTGILLGYFYFHERLSTIQYFGVGLGIIALALLLFPTEIFAK